MTTKDTDAHDATPAAEPLALRLSEGLGAGDEAGRQKCAECAWLRRSGVNGRVWHCGALRAGKSVMYASTARLAQNGQRQTCGPDARLFLAAPLEAPNVAIKPRRQASA